jgi:serine protease Do
MHDKTKQFLRENFLGLSLTLIGVACLVLAGVLYEGHRAFPQYTLANGQGLDGPDIDALAKQDKAYERIAQSVTPGIVAIQSTQVVKVQQNPLFMDPFFRQFFGDMLPQIPRERREHALGSGVIVSPDGYILTNNHVVANATSIDVMLSNLRILKGKVVGSDAWTDVAVVKVDAKDLPTVPLGDSDTLHVGDTVMAFGNPFGEFFTVTRGTVSALGRAEGRIEQIQNFIQTDAAINQGNSGGALVNVRGQVVGINTAILSGSSGPGGGGGFIGIGFAIPVNMAKHVMEGIIRTGKVSRGWLGVQIGSLDEKVAKQFKVPDTSGALLNEVTPGGPADKAGLKIGDVVRKLDGRTVENHEQLTAMVTNIDPGTTVTLDILRDGNPMTIRVTLGERPANLGLVAGVAQSPSQGPLRGITVQNLTPALRNQLGLPSSVQGVMISEVDPSSPAAQTLGQGDVIESIDKKPVRSVTDFNNLAPSQGDTLLRINRQGQAFFVVISGDAGGGEQ